jgi:LPS-assembly lipoprotein
MLFYRLLLSFCLCLLLGSCGFRPLYMTSEPISNICYPIKIKTIKDRNGQILRNQLLDILTPEGMPEKPKYILEINLTETIKAIGVNKDETTSRKEAILTAAMKLTDAKSGKILYTHSVISINSFEVISQDYYSDVVAQDYAKVEALRLLAEKIKLTLSAYLDSKNEN